MDEAIALVEVVCAELATEGRRVTFPSVATRTGISRTTLYRRADLRAVVEEHRIQGKGANTLSGLAMQLDQVRHSLEAVAAVVRHHEEVIRQLQHQRKAPKTK